MFKFLITTFIFVNIYGFNVNHQIKPGADFETMSLGNSCSTFVGDKFTLSCNPASFPYYQSEGISLSLLGKADGDSIDNGRDLIFDPITEDLIRRLFEQKSFNSFTFDGSIKFNTSMFELTYTPYYLIGDLYIFNPAFPEISINLLNRETLRLTSGDEISQNKWGAKSISIGYSFFYYSHSYATNTFSLFDLSSKDAEELIAFKDDTGFDGKLSLLYLSNISFIPNISLQVHNFLDSAKFEKPNTDITQESILLFERYTTIGLGKSFQTTYGELELNFELFFSNFLDEFYSKYATLGMRYNLNLFSVNLAGSINYQNIGFLFRSENFNVGISYAREKDAPIIQSDYDNSTYIQMEVSL